MLIEEKKDLGTNTVPTTYGPLLKPDTLKWKERIRLGAAGGQAGTFSLFSSPFSLPPPALTHQRQQDNPIPIKIFHKVVHISDLIDTSQW